MHLMKNTMGRTREMKMMKTKTTKTNLAQTERMTKTTKPQTQRTAERTKPQTQRTKKRKAKMKMKTQRMKMLMTTKAQTKRMKTLMTTKATKTERTDQTTGTNAGGVKSYMIISTRFPSVQATLTSAVNWISSNSFPEALSTGSATRG